MDTGETVLAVMPREHLTTALAMFHRGGFGHVIRVLDPQRAPIRAQLIRAGVSEARLMRCCGTSDVLLLVHAPARTGQAVSLASQFGATDTEVVARERSVADSVAPGLITHVGERRGRRGASRKRDTVPTSPVAVDDAQVAD